MYVASFKKGITGNLSHWNSKWDLHQQGTQGDLHCSLPVSWELWDPISVQIFMTKASIEWNFQSRTSSSLFVHTPRQDACVCSGMSKEQLWTCSWRAIWGYWQLFVLGKYKNRAHGLLFLADFYLWLKREVIIMVSVVGQEMTAVNLISMLDAAVFREGTSQCIP